MAEPEKGIPFQFDFAVISDATGIDFQDNPTISPGDFKILKDEGDFVDLTILPVVKPAGDDNILVILTADEMNADRIVIRAEDLTPEIEWRTRRVNITTDLPGGPSRAVNISQLTLAHDNTKGFRRSAGNRNRRCL